MTICLVIKCQNRKKKPSILLASDSQESSSFLKRSTTKIKPILGIAPVEKIKVENNWCISLASAGDPLVTDEVYQDVNDLLTDKIPFDFDLPSVALKLHRKEIGDLAYEIYRKHKDKGLSDPVFELLLGAADEYSTILYITHEGKVQEIDQYAIIGSGETTSGELILNEFFRKDMNIEEAAYLASLMVTVMGHCGISAGGVPDIRICQDRSWKAFPDEAFKDIMGKTGLRWGLLKKAWLKMQANNTLETKISRLLK
jgi:hypothetical protein